MSSGVAARTRLLAGLVATSVGLAGCAGVEPTDQRVLGPDEVPFGLLDPDREPRTVPTSPAVALVEVYLVGPDGDSLLGVPREVERPTVDVVLAELARPVPPLEATAGLTNPLEDLDAVTVELDDGGLATIGLPADLEDLSGEDQILALAQLVFTATARPPVERVVFTLDDEPIDVPAPDGTLLRGPVERDDYRDLAPTS